MLHYYELGTSSGDERSEHYSPIFNLYIIPLTAIITMQYIQAWSWKVKICRQASMFLELLLISWENSVCILHQRWVLTNTQREHSHFYRKTSYLDRLFNLIPNFYATHGSFTNMKFFPPQIMFREQYDDEAEARMTRGVVSVGIA